MKRFLFPEKSATPDNIGDKNETSKKDAESTKDIKTEEDNSVPKKFTVTSTPFGNSVNESPCFSLYVSRNLAVVTLS